MLLKVSSAIEIPESEKNTFWVSQILSQLTRTSKNFNNPDVLDTLVFYDIKNGVIKIPRLFNIKNCDVILDYQKTEGETININAKWKPRNELQEEGVKYFCTNDHGILKLNPGEGKTIISILSICKMKKKCIIFVHKDSLVSQWKERFLQASDIKEEDIGILETNSYLEVIKKPVVIGTVQTMNSMIKKYPSLEKDFIKANFGIGIWDECHTTGGAPLFSKSIYYIPAKKCFGLSATPSRSDHNDDIIGMHLGKVIEPKGKSDTLKPRIVMTYVNFLVMDKFSYFINYGFPDKNGKRQEYPQFDKNRYLTMLTSKKQPRYINTVHKIIDVLYKKNRNILVLCDRIKIIDKLAEGFPKEDVGAIEGLYATKFMQKYKPLTYGFFTSPEISILRKGKPGRLVNETTLGMFNRNFTKTEPFFKRMSKKFTHINTDEYQGRLNDFVFDVVDTVTSDTRELIEEKVQRRKLAEGPTFDD
jgi:hypothetical protein